MRYSDPYFREFLNYWKQLANEAGGVPTRQQFNPADIKGCLPHIYLIERHEDNHFVTRLTGSGLDFASDGEYRLGDDLSRFGKRDREAYGVYFDSIFSGPCGAWSERLFVAVSGTAFNGDTVSLPLFDTRKDIQIALGMVRLTPIQDRNKEIEVTGQEYSRLLSLQYFDVGYGLPEGLWSYSSGISIE